MELDQELFIAEVLSWNRGSKCSNWGPWPAEMVPLKSKLRRIWNAGDYDRLSYYMQCEAEAFYRRVAIPPGSTLLDVACGSGQLALIAAHNGVDATSVDIAEKLVGRHGNGHDWKA